MKSIDLGRKSECCGMSIPAAPMPDKDPEKFYPSLYLDADGESDLAKLPEYGTMTVTFERERLSKNDTDGKKSVSVCLKIKSIDKVKAAPEDSGEDAGKVLDKYAAEEND